MLNFLNAIQRDGQSFLQLYTRDPDRSVPSCPGWVVHNLYNHVDETCRDTLRKFGVEVPETGLAAALDALQTVGIEASDPRLQDLAEECALHLWDAQNAFDEAQPVEAELACIGVDEYFEVAAPGVLQYRGIRAGDGQTLHLHQTDGDGEWFVILDALPIMSHQHAKADVAIRGTASELFLCLWGRIEPPGVIGDIEVFRHFRAVTKH